MRTPLLAAVCLGLLLLAPASEAATSTRGVPPTGLHGFLLRADEPVRSSFPRTPSFAWNPVTLITAPAGRSLLRRPRRSSVFGVPPSIAQFSTVPSGFLTSM